MIGITHSDLDGLVSTMLAGISFNFEPEQVFFARPSDAQKGLIDVFNKETVVTDLPYVLGSTFWFDHHLSNILDGPRKIPGIRKIAPSCAGILKKEQEIQGYDRLVEETDRIDSLQLTGEEIINPQEYYLLSKLINEDIDGRDTISFNHYLTRLMKDNDGDIKKIFTDPKVQEKIEEFSQMQRIVRPYLKRTMQLQDDILIVDLLSVPSNVYNRCAFMYDPFVLGEGTKSSVMTRLYHPNQNTQLVRFQVLANKFTSDKMFDRNIGTFLHSHGGGGHPYSGGVTVPIEKFEETYKGIMNFLRR